MQLSDVLKNGIELRQKDIPQAKRIFNQIVSDSPGSHEAEVAQTHLDMINVQEEAAEKHTQALAQALAQEDEMRSSSKPPKPKGRFLLWFFGVSLGSMLLGMVLTGVIPGCTVDTGRGASGCGAFGELIILLAAGGFFLLMFTIIVVLPFWGLLAFLHQIRTRKNKP